MCMHRQRALPDRSGPDDRQIGGAAPACIRCRSEQRAGRLRRRSHPLAFPDYQRVDDAAARARFEDYWDVTLDDKPGLTWWRSSTRRSAARSAHGTSWARTPPCPTRTSTTRARRCGADHLVVQTSSHRDRSLPIHSAASAFAEKTGPSPTPIAAYSWGAGAAAAGRGAARPVDHQQLAQRLGLEWYYSDAGRRVREMRHAMPSIAGIPGRSWSVRWRVLPAPREGDASESGDFHRSFPHTLRPRRFVPAKLLTADEVPDRDYRWC